MRHNRLHSVAHNFADSLASGLGFVVGYCPTDVFADAAASPDCVLGVDFLAGEVVAGFASAELQRALPLYRDAFSEFCRRHDVERSDFSQFTVQYALLGQLKRYTVTVRDQKGRTSSREYEGGAGRRVKEVDALGRLRPKVIRDG